MCVPSPPRLYQCTACSWQYLAKNSSDRLSPMEFQLQSEQCPCCGQLIRRYDNPSMYRLIKNVLFKLSKLEIKI